jgi:hypothetical protein
MSKNMNMNKNMYVHMFMNINTDTDIGTDTGTETDTDMDVGYELTGYRTMDFCCVRMKMLNLHCKLLIMAQRFTLRYERWQSYSTQ